MKQWGQRYLAMFHPDLARHPDSCPALVLNADYTPLSYYPLSLWPWQNRMMMARVKWQAITIILLVLIGLFAAGSS